MSSDNELDEPLIVPAVTKEDQFVDLSYRQEITKRVVQFVGLFYLVYGVFVTYVWTCKELDVKSWNRPVINYFWDPVIAIYSFGNFVVFGMVAITKWWGWRVPPPDRKIPIRRPENHIIVCFILIPLFVATCIVNIIRLVREVAIMPCHGYCEFLVPLSTLALMAGAATLIFDLGFFQGPTLGPWSRSLIKSHLIFFTVVGVANCLIINVALQHMLIFRNESLNSSYNDRFKPNNTCVNATYTTRTLETTYETADKYLGPAFVLFCVCTLAYFIQPLLDGTSPYAGSSKKTPSDQSTELVYSSSSLTSVTDFSLVSDSEVDKSGAEDHMEEDSSTLVAECHDGRVSYRLPSASLVLCITFLSLSFLSFIIMYSLRQVVGKTKDGRPNTPHQSLGSLIFCCFISIVYIIGSVLSAVHLREIQRWPPAPHVRGKVIDKCLIWIGAGGQLSLSLTLIADSVVLLVEDQDHVATTEAMLVMLIFSSLLVMVQTFFQTAQVSLLLDRRWIRPKINSLAESLCPAVGMMGLNMGLLLLSIDQLKSPVLRKSSSVMFVDMFTSELRCVGETLGILQRLHASLMFASMIIYTHN